MEGTIRATVKGNREEDYIRTQKEDGKNNSNN
jgi:hypothetical protein